MTETPESEMDEALLEMLEEEFMDMAHSGQFKAVTFAISYSEEYCAASVASDMMILSGKTGRGLGPFIREKLLTDMNTHVAPLWARANYDKRKEELAAQAEEI